MSELKTAFQIGFLIYIPFMIIDLVVGSVLMSMGMMMLPPVMISLPFKLLLFVMVDGWYLLVKSLIMSFSWWGELNERKFCHRNCKGWWCVENGIYYNFNYLSKMVLLK